MQFCFILFNYFENCDKIQTISDRSEDKLNDKIIKSLIEKTLEDKMMTNTDFIRYSFYELRVKFNLSEQETERFLELIRKKLLNENYQVYFTGAKFEYKEEKITVGNNDLMVAVKNN